VAKTGGGTDYTFISGGGAASRDRITFVSYPAAASLITSDLTGYLAIKSRFQDDSYFEIQHALDMVSVSVGIREVI
jgi:hypothetical protein